MQQIFERCFFRNVSNSPVLLFGMPRSGTTWLGKIFDSHPDTLYRHEPDSGGSLNGIPLFAETAQAQKYESFVQAFVARLPTIASVRVAGSLPTFPKSYLSAPRLLGQRVAIMATRAAEKLSLELPIPPAVDTRRSASVRVVWKSIESVGRLGLIARALPDSRAILILRHPCAYVASVLKGEAADRFSSADRSSEDYQVLGWLLEAASHHVAVPSMAKLKQLHPVERLAWRWLLSNAKALADIEGLGNCTYVRYEDVCMRPNEQARKLLEFCGLSWHPQVARFITQCTSRHSERYYSVFKDPLIAATRWQQTLPEVDIQRVRGIVHGHPVGDMYFCVTESAVA